MHPLLLPTGTYGPRKVILRETPNPLEEPACLPSRQKAELDARLEKQKKDTGRFVKSAPNMARQIVEILADPSITDQHDVESAKEVLLKEVKDDYELRINKDMSGDDFVLKILRVMKGANRFKVVHLMNPCTCS
ncbi:MAG: hypothetical protein V4519_01785 [Patescibacteria group bacterium]